MSREESDTLCIVRKKEKIVKQLNFFPFFLYHHPPLRQPSYSLPLELISQLRSASFLSCFLPSSCLPVCSLFLFNFTTQLVNYSYPSNHGATNPDNLLQA